MIISNYLLEYLTKNGKATLSGFGSFAGENAAAVLNQENKTLLPPGKKITFLADYEIQNDEFAQFLAGRKNISVESALAELKQQTDFWKNKINEGENFTIENLGEFKISGESVKFMGNRIAAENSDFYGLEEINLNDLRKNTGIQQVKTEENPAKKYRFSNALLWILLLTIPVSGMVYVGIYQPEMLFGKKSFPAAPKEKKIIKKDTAQTRVKPTLADSLKTDSVKTAAAVVPTKKWTKKSNRKYTKNKWRKAKKRVNRSQ
ncbi:MAG: hypothetical protein K0M56_09430 [Kaistella sp.]|nr:hypothetical protein [Kaistella sp.]